MRKINNVEFGLNADEKVVCVDIQYPQNEGNLDTIEIGLSDVRAADGIRVSYDFDRDGWSIKQERIIRHEWGGESTGNYQEVAFVPSWGLETEGA